MPHLYVATNGLSMWASDDLGERIARMPTSAGIYSGSHVWGLAVHPTNPGELITGTNFGIFRWNQKDKKFTQLPFPMAGLQNVTALAYSPQDPMVIVAGTQPGQLFRTYDGGQTWQQVCKDISRYAERYFDGHWTRVTSIIFDPKNPNHVWAGVEIDGVWFSDDVGVNWQRVGKDTIPPDIHGFGISHTNGKTNLFATTNKGVFCSNDEGDAWELKHFESKYHFTRSVVARPDNKGVMFATNGDGPPGLIGELFRSRDFGATWQKVAMPTKLESSLYFVAVHPSNPMLVFAACNLGQIFRSTDGGESWKAIERRLPEIRAMAWLPDTGNGAMPTRSG